MKKYYIGLTETLVDKVSGSRNFTLRPILTMKQPPSHGILKLDVFLSVIFCVCVCVCILYSQFLSRADLRLAARIKPAGWRRLPTTAISLAAQFLLQPLPRDIFTKYKLTSGADLR
jgi:hypothetical protein